MEQQKLGKLKTSAGPVQQKPFRRSKKKKKGKKQVIKENAQDLVEELQRQGKDAVGPSLSFLTSSSNNPPANFGRLTSNSDFRTGRQTNTDKVVVPGFPTGLPNGTPEGVKIALASAVQGPDGEFIMNPIPGGLSTPKKASQAAVHLFGFSGQAGVDFPVLADVPDTGFDCGAQEHPGIYGDIDADCQVSRNMLCLF